LSEAVLLPVKAVLDTNVLFSAALAQRDERRGLARWVVDVALIAQRRFQHVTSDLLMNELQRVLSRPGMLDSQGAADFVDNILDVSTLVRVRGIAMGVRDPNDDKVIETAMNGDVDFVVSEDADLHDLSARRAIAKVGIGIRARPIRVITLRELVAELEGTPRYSPLIAPELLPATLAA
jgi:putative PIN family toxin of toxin-antitoxin system